MVHELTGRFRAIPTWGLRAPGTWWRSGRVRRRKKGGLPGVEFEVISNFLAIYCY